MKPLKTRIKKTTRADGTVIYTAQYRHLFVWYPFSEHTVMWQPKSPYRVWVESDYPAKSSNIEDTKSLIDQYIDKFNCVVEHRIKRKVVKEEYIKYP